MKKASKKKAQQPTPASRFVESPGRLALVIFVFAFLLYANTLGHDFVWDDFELIVQNPALQTFDPSTIGRVFTEGFWPVEHRGASEYYRPLVTLSYHIDYNLFGQNPMGYHVVNVLLNALVCVAVFLFVSMFFGNTVLGLVTSLIFAVHPVHTENVAWISGRTDIITTFWMIVSLGAYAGFRRLGNTLLLLASLAAFALALLAKELAAVLPLIIGLLEFSRSDNGRRWGHAAAVTAGYFVVLIAYLFLRQSVLGAFPDVATDDGQGTGALPFSILTGYVFKLLWPLRLSAEYDAPIPSSYTHPYVIAGTVLLMIMGWARWHYRNKTTVTLGTTIFVLGVLPVLHFIPLNEISAERFLYFPSLGFALVLGGIFSNAVRSRLGGSLSHRPPNAGFLTVVLVFVLVNFVGRTLARNMDWKNETVLFTKTAAQEPNNPRAHFNLGDVARANGDLEGAVREYKRAIELKPDYSTAMTNLSGVYLMQGRVDDALQLLMQAAVIMPDNATIVSNLGILFLEKRDFAKASAQFEQALRINPNEYSAQLGMGFLKLGQNNPDEARTYFQLAVKGGVQFNIAYFQLAVIENNAGNRAQAQDYARRFLATYQKNDATRQQAERIAGGR